MPDRESLRLRPDDVAELGKEGAKRLAELWANESNHVGSKKFADQKPHSSELETSFK